MKKSLVISFISAFMLTLTACGSVKVNDNGVWKDVPAASGIKVNVDGAQKPATQVHVSDNGVWKPVYPPPQTQPLAIPDGTVWPIHNTLANGFYYTGDIRAWVQTAATGGAGLAQLASAPVYVDGDAGGWSPPWDGFRFGPYDPGDASAWEVRFRITVKDDAGNTASATIIVNSN